MTITNEDNMAMMSRYSDKYFDLAIVDPPYELGGHGFSSTAKINSDSNLQNTNLKFQRIDRKSNGVIDNLGGRPPKEYWSELFRVSKNQIVWGLQYFVEHLTNTSAIIIWDKKNGDSYFSDAELAWTSFSGATRIIRCWNEPAGLGNKGRVHPTQKPIALYEQVLDRYAKAGDKIIDTHLGSGNIAIACKNRGFDITACEINTNYYNSAIDNILKNTAQQKLMLG
jgi:site-specific DNA-methyltransferase (adenine-specific)